MVVSEGFSNLEKRLDADNFRKLGELGNERVLQVVSEAVDLYNPAKIKVLTGSASDLRYIRDWALAIGEEQAQRSKNHTFHFDAPHDMGRVMEHTYILNDGQSLGDMRVVAERSQGIAEARDGARNKMQGREMLVGFYVLGSPESDLAYRAVQITDSYYAAHSAAILNFSGYQDFLQKKPRDFLYFYHTKGPVDGRQISTIANGQRIYIDPEGMRAFAENTTYVGNAILKKLVFRLTIYDSLRRGKLSEHMGLMVLVPRTGGQERGLGVVAPSGCGKTFTTTLEGHRIVNDDLALIESHGRQVRAVPVEDGVFGIIKSVNTSDDKMICDVIGNPGNEVIYSNVLVGEDGKPYWTDMGVPYPAKGTYYGGRWETGLTSSDGKLIVPSHDNARFLVKLDKLPNLDQKYLHSPDGMPLDAILYMGRDPDTNPPVTQTRSWAEGVLAGATLESIRTATVTTGVGQSFHNPMAIYEFLPVRLGYYLQKHLEFGERLVSPPTVFMGNYFRVNEAGKYITAKEDAKVWVEWIAGRLNGKFGAIETPVGLIPRYEDLQNLFQAVLSKSYTREDYVAQFSISVGKFLAKNSRMVTAFAKEGNIPEKIFKLLANQKRELLAARDKCGSEIISPFEF